MFMAKVYTDGALVIRTARDADWRWKLRNFMTWNYIWGMITTFLAKLFSKVTGIPTIISELRASVIKRNGEVIDYGVICRRVVTTVGIGFLTDTWRGTQDISTMIYHATGIGAGAEAAADTALNSECTTQLTVNNTRATGTLAGSGLTFQTVGTPSFDESAAVTEHGLFSDPDRTEGVLWDRSLFTAINVINGDSIQFTYTATFAAGG